MINVQAYTLRVLVVTAVAAILLAFIPVMTLPIGILAGATLLICLDGIIGQETKETGHIMIISFVLFFVLIIGQIYLQSQGIETPHDSLLAYGE